MKKEFILFLDDKSITHCYITKNGWYYRPNSSGYTDIKEEAGIYTKEEGVKHALSCDKLLLIPIKDGDLKKESLAEVSS